jgi:hypothetical protein
LAKHIRERGKDNGRGCGGFERGLKNSCKCKGNSFQFFLTKKKKKTSIGWAPNMEYGREKKKNIK